LSGYLNQGRADVNNALDPIAELGNQSGQLQAALTGALGPEAQAAALAEYQSSPGQQFLQQEQEKALLRNSAALGGGVSADGRVQTALQEQAFGRAQTDFDNN